MKRLLSILILLLILIPAPSYAIEGTCSWHGGVNCNAGADWDGSAVCVDGWRDSSELYSQAQMCHEIHYYCTQEEHSQINLKYKVDEKYQKVQEISKQIDPISQRTLDPNTDTKTRLSDAIEANRILGIQQQAIIEFNTAFDSANNECWYLGALEHQKMLLDLQNKYYSPQPQTQWQPTQIPIKDTGPNLTNDERCKSLGFGDWFNTDTQNCDTCPYGETKDPNSNSCKTPNPKVTPSQSVEKSIPDKPKEPTKPNVSEAVPVKIEAVATTTETTSSIQVIATTTIPEPIPTPVPPVTIHEPLPQPKTFWTKLIDWFKFW